VLLSHARVILAPIKLFVKRNKKIVCLICDNVTLLIIWAKCHYERQGVMSQKQIKRYGRRISGHT